jgi:hypothetical protein
MRRAQQHMQQQVQHLQRYGGQQRKASRANGR